MNTHTEWQILHYTKKSVNIALVSASFLHGFFYLLYSYHAALMWWWLETFCDLERGTFFIFDLLLIRIYVFAIFFKHLSGKAQLKKSEYRVYLVHFRSERRIRRSREFTKSTFLTLILNKVFSFALSFFLFYQILAANIKKI